MPNRVGILTSLTMSYVQQMIEEGEHQTQDFKMRIDDAAKIARTLSPMELIP